MMSTNPTRGENNDPPAWLESPKAGRSVDDDDESKASGVSGPAGGVHRMPQSARLAAHQLLWKYSLMKTYTNGEDWSC